ncbi:hypothetical protein OR1_04194 [Geobacter sp. OR-1]|nr:hypothetical protein OR1_04194 [Geobacter sp. OR-1]
MAVMMCICLLTGRKQMKAMRTPAWTHQDQVAKGKSWSARGECLSRVATKDETGM